VHRLIRRLGANGFFVSKYAADVSDICAVFEGNYVQDIEQIRIRIDNNFSYGADMKYEFYAAPLEKK
jgi:hypothetical protein